MNNLPKPAGSINFDIFEKIKIESDTESISSEIQELEYISDEEYNENYSFIKKELKFKKKYQENSILLKNENLILKEEEYLSE
tara:strand:+ start:1661 stop:1909 length:249 start_codon:yes stop_codon:yes gene_type:complete